MRLAGVATANLHVLVGIQGHGIRDGIRPRACGRVQSWGRPRGCRVLEDERKGGMRGCSTLSGCQLAYISGGDSADRLLASPCLTLHSRQIQSTGTGLNHVHDHI